MTVSGSVSVSKNICNILPLYYIVSLKKTELMKNINFFVVWLTDDMRLALFPTGTIVRDPHHPWISDTPQVRFEHAQNLNSVFVVWSCTVLITTTPRPHKYRLHFSYFAESFLKCIYLSITPKTSLNHKYFPCCYIRVLGKQNLLRNLPKSKCVKQLGKKMFKTTTVEILKLQAKLTQG